MDHGQYSSQHAGALKHWRGLFNTAIELTKPGIIIGNLASVLGGYLLAASGHVGNSMLPHLHFHVSDPARGETVPVSFADLDRHRGVPRMFHRYTSGNAPPP